MEIESIHPTPWHLGEHVEFGHCIFDAAGNVVPISAYKEHIIACVNACAPWTTEELQKGAPMAQINAAMDARMADFLRSTAPNMRVLNPGYAAIRTDILKRLLVLRFTSLNEVDKREVLEAILPGCTNDKPEGKDSANRK